MRSNPPGLSGNTDLTVLRTAPQLPALGDTVHYRSYGTPGGEYTPECRAAMVTDVPADPPSGSETEIGLVVFNPDGIFLKRGIRHADHPAGTGGTWHHRCEQ